MAKRTLINKKTGLQLSVNNHEEIMAQHPGIFRLIPNTSISDEVVKKEQKIAKEIKSPQEDEQKKTIK